MPLVFINGVSVQICNKPRGFYNQRTSDHDHMHTPNLLSKTHGFPRLDERTLLLWDKFAQHLDYPDIHLESYQCLGYT